jgi:hypothetical protein
MAYFPDRDRRQVADTPLIHGLRLQSIQGEPLSFTLSRNVRVRIAGGPRPHLDRGTTVAGGREYSSADWHPDEYLDLLDAQGQIVAHLRSPVHDARAAALGARQISDWPTVAVDLPAGTYTTAASPEFIGGYELHIREIA